MCIRDSIYSIWKKMQRKALPIEELYDLRALRVLVDDLPTCYAVLGLSLIHISFCAIRRRKPWPNTRAG